MGAKTECTQTVWRFPPPYLKPIFNTQYLYTQPNPNPMPKAIFLVKNKADKKIDAERI